MQAPKKEIVRCCKPCKDAHKQCNGARPCDRCLASSKECEEPPAVKRGRPRKKGKDEALAPAPSQEDVRSLSHCRELLLRHPAVILADPELAARAFGIDLVSEFFVCELPPQFETAMTLAVYEQLSQIKFMSVAMCAFLRVDVGQCTNQAAIKWLNQVCSPDCVRQCMTTPMEEHCVRRWKHKKLYQRDEVMFECNVRGFLLPRVRIMFVDIASHSALAAETDFEASKFLWSDFGDLDAMDCDGVMRWDDDWADVFLAQMSLK
jgi:hypothetical protein